MQCGVCQGRGFYDVMGERACYGCAGTGRDMQSDLMALPCNVCNGRRRLSYCEKRKCNNCGGTGRVGNRTMGLTNTSKNNKKK